MAADFASEFLDFEPVYGYRLPEFISYATAYLGFVAGGGVLSSNFPSALTTIDSVPVSAEVLVRWRAPTPGQSGDGALVARATSSPAGEWSVSGLNPALRYDISARHVGENDALQSDVTPFDPP